MRHLLNTLYILTPNAYLVKDGENIVVRIDDEETLRVPIHNLESILCFSYMGASPGAMSLCVQNGVKLSFLSPTGKYIGSLEGPIKGNVLLRREQYRLADDDVLSSHLASIFIAGKIANHRSVLARFCRDHHPSHEVESEIEEARALLRQQQHKLSEQTSRLGVMGVEGYAANVYFGLFQHLILNKEFTFSGRSKHPPKDEVNALLSFFYTLLAHDVRAALETVGLDAYVGFLHVDRPGRPGLALDLMEEMRAYLVDRFILSIINKRQIERSDFIPQGEKGFLLKEDARKRLIGLWQKRKKDEITHPFLKEKMPLGLLPYIQALLLARHLRGDLDDYPVFLMI